MYPHFVQPAHRLDFGEDASVANGRPNAPPMEFVYGGQQPRGSVPDQNNVDATRPYPTKSGYMASTCVVGEFPHGSDMKNHVENIKSIKRTGKDSRGQRVVFKCGRPGCKASFALSHPRTPDGFLYFLANNTVHDCCPELDGKQFIPKRRFN